MVSSPENVTKAHLPNCHVILFFADVGFPLRVNAQIRRGSNQGESAEMVSCNGLIRLNGLIRRTNVPFFPQTCSNPPGNGFCFRTHAQTRRENNHGEAAELPPRPIFFANIGLSLASVV